MLLVRTHINNFLKKQFLSTPFHVKLALSLIGLLFLVVLSIKKLFDVFKKEESSNSEIIQFVVSLNKYLKSFARVYRSLTVLSFYEYPLVKNLMENKKVEDAELKSIGKNEKA